MNNVRRSQDIELKILLRLEISYLQAVLNFQLDVIFKQYSYFQLDISSRSHVINVFFLRLYRQSTNIKFLSISDIKINFLAGLHFYENLDFLI